MKNRLFFFKMLLFVALMATWTSCSKSDDIEASDPKPVNPTPTNPTNPTDKTDPKDDPYMVVCEHVAEVANKVSDYFDKCSSITELEQYKDEIIKQEHVVDCYTTNTTMFVEVEGFGTVSYSYFPEAETNIFEDLPSYSAKNTRAKRAPGNYNIGNYTQFLGKNVVIVNQLKNDEGRIGQSKNVGVVKPMFDKFKKFGFIAKEEEPTLDFFHEKMFEYDMVFILTHGIYDKKNNLHWLFTSEFPNSDNSKSGDFIDGLISSENIYVSKNYPKNQVSFGRIDEKGGTRWYARVSEEFIASSNEKFKKKAIVFNGACESMMGPNKHTEDSIDSGMGKVFIKKGAGLYLGYDRENNVGAFAGPQFFENLMAGMSLEDAYDQLNFSYKHNFQKDKFWFITTKKIWADLIACWDSTSIDALKQTCIMKPQFIEPLSESIKDLSNESNIKWKLSASSIYYYDRVDYDNNEKGPFTVRRYDFRDTFRYGFIISESANMYNPTVLLTNKIEEEGCVYSNSDKMVYYSQVLDGNVLKPETTYYVWPAFNSGTNTYYGERHSFTTGALKGSGGSDTNTSGQGNLPNVPGSDL